MSLLRFLAQFVTLITSVLKSLVIRGRSPWSRLRNDPSTVLCPRSLQQCGRERSGNWWHCSFRLFGISCPPAPLILLDIRLRSHRVTSALLETCPPSLQTKPWTACSSGRFEERSGKGVRRSGGPRGLVHHWWDDWHGRCPFQSVCKGYNVAT